MMKVKTRKYIVIIKDDCELVYDLKMNPVDSSKISDKDISDIYDAINKAGK